MPQFQFGTTTIDYTLDFQENKRDVTISVEWLDGVKVKAPEGIEEEKLQEVLHKKAPWILEKWGELNEIVDPPVPKEFISGEKFPYLGRHYRLKVHKKKNRESKIIISKRAFYCRNPRNHRRSGSKTTTPQLIQAMVH